MSNTKVADFLTASSFTSQRPPADGEENELTSNGGNSTKSSGSHKSFVSNKSHSSSKSATSTKMEANYSNTHNIQSPSSTPRKSTLKKATKIIPEKIEAMDTNAPRESEIDGSAANSPPYSENGTPPHLKWAENLTYLLDDSDGVELFKEFLDSEMEGGAEELTFWFACQGLKSKMASKNVENSMIVNIQKAIYKRYVRSEKVKCISKDVKRDIAEKMTSKGPIDRQIFDLAQDEVVNFLRDVMYPAFLRSDFYVQYVQNNGYSPKSSQSSGSNSARPVSQSGLLPVVHEDRELDISIEGELEPHPVITKPPSALKRSSDSNSSWKHEIAKGSVLYPHRVSTSSYPVHHSYAPTSAQDSELQSLSSDALTDDTVSITDSSVDGYPAHLIRKKNHKRLKSLAQQNRELKTGLHSQIIPRTEHAPKDRNTAESDPKRFSQLLIERLTKVVEERENENKVVEKIRSISEPEKSEDEKGNASKSNTSTIIPLMRPIPAMDEETAESILEQHCSRVWAPSSHHTPSYSPHGPQSPPHSKSPDRHKDARKKNLPANASPALASKGYHKKRDFSMVYDSGIEDRNVIRCGTETHRHIHHHHHHHHSTRDSTKKIAELEAQVSPWGDSSQGYSDYPSGDHSRGRTSTRKGANGPRKGSDTSSIIDSGISVVFDKDSARIAPNWNPNSEKVMRWMLDSDAQEVLAGGEVERSSSHKRSHRLNQSTGSAQQSRQSSKVKGSTRSTSMERTSGLLSTWSAATSILPSQPFVQDPSMPLINPPNTTTQLEEAKRRLAAEAASPIKSKSFAGVSSREKLRPSVGSTALPTTAHMQTLPSARTVPTDLDSSNPLHTIDRISRKPPLSVPLSQHSSSSCTIVGIYMGQEPIPYKLQLPGRSVTLAQVKTLVNKRGPFKYFFKRDSDEFGDGAGAVFEEITDDHALVPMWQGKVVVKVDSMDL